MPSTATYLQRPDPPAFIALVCGDQPPACGLTQALQRSLGRVVRSGKLVEVIDADGCDVVAVHYDALSPRERAEVKERLRDCSGPPTLFLFERCEAADLAELFDAHSLRNMLVVNHCGVDASDLVVTVQKLRTEDIFGLEKYFVWGVSPRRTTLRSSEEAPAVIDQVVAFAQARGIGARLRATIRTVADEFLSNALYNAPVAADGTHRYESRPRTLPVTLEAHEAIDVSYCCDGRRFGLSIADPFGSITPGRLQAHLARTFRGGVDQINDLGGGAGIGLYQIFGSLSHFIINIAPGARTEMIGLVDVSGSYKTFASAGRSFNIFVKGGAR